MKTDPIIVAFTCLVISLLTLLGGYGVLVHEFHFAEKRKTFYLTSTVALNKMNDLSDVFMNAASYDIFSNYPFVPYVYFTNAPNGSGPNLLQDLLDISGCSIPIVRPDRNPMNRSSRCMCITESYVDFFNRTGSTYTNVSLADRQLSKDKVTSCLKHRPMWNTSHCGDLCELHPLELAYYCNVVVILCCVNFLLSKLKELMCLMRVRKVVLFLVTVLFVGLLSFLSPVRTIFSMVSIVVVMLLLVFGFTDEDQQVIPEPPAKPLPPAPGQDQVQDPNQVLPGPAQVDPASFDPNQIQPPAEYDPGQPQNQPDYHVYKPEPSPDDYNDYYSGNPNPAQAYMHRYYAYAYSHAYAQQYRPLQAAPRVYYTRRGYYLGVDPGQNQPEDPVMYTSHPEPHDLTLALWTNLKILFPVYCVYIAVHGYGRDYVNVICFGVTGMIIGISMQNHLWEEWVFDGNYQWYKKTTCLVIALVGLLNLILLSVAYIDVHSPYMQAVAIPVIIFIVVFGLIMLEGFAPLINQKGVFGLKDVSVYFVVVGLNILLTVISSYNTLST
jgi:hypothetical protein